jgi:hypothetical protein
MEDWTKSLLLLCGVCWLVTLCHKPLGAFRDSAVGTVIGWLSRKIASGGSDRRGE